MKPRFLPIFENCDVSPPSPREKEGEKEYDEDAFISDVLAFELGSFTDKEWFCFRDGLKWAMKNEIAEDSAIQKINSFVRGRICEYRVIDVRSAGSFHIYPNPITITHKMKVLIDFLKREKMDLFGVSKFFYDFLCIHPFSDGNGRTAHIICCVLLNRYLGKFIPLTFSSRQYLVRNMEEGLDFVYGFVLLCVSRFKPVDFT